jgi:preprotein translocase subunit SecE
VADEEKSTKAPRRIRRIETIREKVEKGSAVEDTPKKRGPIRRFFSMFSKPLRPVGRFFRWLSHYRVMRIIGYIIVWPYIRNSFKELKAVTWPTKRESRRLTLAVIVFAIVFGVLIAVVDYGLDKIFKRILLK